MQRTCLLSARLFSVEHRVYAGEKGESVARDVVVHPGAVVVLPVLDDGRIVLIRNYRYAVERELWELPAGTREPDEPPGVTAGRELLEETGYRAGHMEPFAEFYTSPGILTERMHAFLATELVQVGQRTEPGERIVVELVDRARILDMLKDGELRDGKSIAVLATYFLREHT